MAICTSVTSSLNRFGTETASDGHHRSGCSGVKARRNTSAAKRQAAKLCYRFGPLTPSARSANLIPGDGTKKAFPAPNKKLSTQPKQPLDRKSPIQVRIRPPPAASQERTGRRRGSRWKYRPGDGTLLRADFQREAKHRLQHYLSTRPRSAFTSETQN
jgi:hypothetical protein